MEYEPCLIERLNSLGDALERYYEEKQRQEKLSLELERIGEANRRRLYYGK